MNQVFYMLIGVPGSGKSTYATELYQQEKEYNKQNPIIISTDEYRKKLFGDAEDVDNNSKLFQTVTKDIIKYLQKGYSVIYDACNVSIKNRREILNRINHKFNDINVEAVVVLTPIEEAKKRNKSRNRIVPEYVIDRMLRNFQLPLKNEGFNVIRYVYTDNSKNTKCAVKEFSKMRNFDQKNPHHNLTLDVHCYKSCLYLMDKNVLKEVRTAALFHDIGKVYTQTWDEEKQICQYFGHENYGAYESLFFKYDENGIIDPITTAYYINYHMIPYILDDMRKDKQEYYKHILKDIWHGLNLLHEADEHSH